MNVTVQTEGNMRDTLKTEDDVNVTAQTDGG